MAHPPLLPSRPHRRRVSASERPPPLSVRAAWDSPQAAGAKHTCTQAHKQKHTCTQAQSTLASSSLFPTTIYFLTYTAIKLPPLRLQAIHTPYEAAVYLNILRQRLHDAPSLVAYLSILLSSGPSPTVGLLHSTDLHSLKVNTPWWELQ